MDYVITVTTSDVRGADTDGRVSVRLVGDKGESEDKALDNGMVSSKFQNLGGVQCSKFEMQISMSRSRVGGRHGREREQGAGQRDGDFAVLNFEIRCRDSNFKMRS